VRDQNVCSMMKADKHPVIRLYKANKDATSPSKKQPGFKREVAAEWQGMLIAYEVVNWFIGLQRGREPLVHADVKWPDEESLGEALRRFKARGTTQVETSMSKRPDDPAGYLVDAKLALQWGLGDHIFPTAIPLSLARLASLQKWLELQSAVFPQKGVRAQLSELVGRLKQKTSWERKDFERAVKSTGLSLAPPEDSEWRWCQAHRGHNSGGYSCALWLLFHTTLANSPRHVAPEALATIAEWVERFFGCEHCAQHFSEYYHTHGGADVRNGGQIGAVLWLWKAHNAVSHRLRHEELESEGSTFRATWPEHGDCEPCKNMTDPKAEWQSHNVFEYHQELYCFESDTYVCSGFDDTSQAKNSRHGNEKDEF